MRLRRLVALVLVLGLAGTACRRCEKSTIDDSAQSTASPTTPTTPTTPPAPVAVPEAPTPNETESDPAWVRPFLWRIESAPPSYLFGTIHMPDKRLRRLPRNAELAFNQATVLSTEIALDGKDDGLFIASAKLPAGTRLDAIVPPQLLERTKETFDAAHQPFAPMTGFKPWFVCMRIGLLDHLNEMATGTPIDKALYGRATNAGKELEPLETISEQARVFDGLEPREQVVFLERTLDGTDLAKREHRDPIIDLLQVYLEGEEPPLMHELYRGYDPKNAVDVKVMKRLIDDRNVVMVDRLKQRLSSGKSYFVAVGAAHLIGPRSVVALLQKSGIKVKRVE